MGSRVAPGALGRLCSKRCSKVDSARSQARSATGSYGGATPRDRGASTAREITELFERGAKEVGSVTVEV